MCRILLALRLAAAALVLAGGGLSPAMAVVIASGDGSQNATAPADNPDWANMARVANASGIYLGDGWMLTAKHVINSNPTPTVTFTDGRVFNTVPGSAIQLTNPFALQAPVDASDLAMFRLTTDPGLPALPIVSATPSTATPVMMIGAGLNRETNVVGWSISSTFVWTQTPLPFSNARGFALDTSSSQMRWGVSSVASGGSTLSTSADNTTTTATFATSFSSTGSPYAAVAAVGDSGGGVFQYIGGHWQLAGIMDSVSSTVSGQPSSTVVFGNNQTQSADLSQYRDEIQSILNLPPPSTAPTALPQPSLLASALSQPAWQNNLNPFDVARTGSVDARDALLLINSLANGKSGPLSGSPTASDLLLDVNGDGVFDIRDVSQTINFLLDGGVNPSVSAASVAAPNVTLVPEPSSGVLALLGLLLMGLARRARFARRANGKV